MINQREKYKAFTQITSTFVTDPAKLQFPSIFNDYLNVLKEINTGNMCPYITTDPVKQAGILSLFNRYLF